MNHPDVFVFHNGRTARSAADLAQIIDEGPPSLFSDHVTQERNDFASWAELALKEHALAARLREVMTREETLAALKTWLAPHQARLEVSSSSHRSDFFIGLLVGLVVGILIMAVVRMLA